MSGNIDPTLCLRLIERRIALGLNQRELAKLMGTAQSAVCDLETGKNDNPKIATLHRWVEALGLKLRINLVDDPPWQGDL
jgi:transcriptional regulator with XRE-family HTH domain